ncbi:trans-sialidase, partial [Trypanosoma cruzi]
IFINFFYELLLLFPQCNIMSLKSLFISAMHLCCTVLFVRPSTYSAPVFTSLLRVSAGTHNHMHTRCTLQWIWMLLLWRVLAVVGGCCCFLRGHEGKEERGSAHGESLFLRVRCARWAATAVEGRILLVCASPPLCRALAHVICYARACWACFSGALGGCHLSMAACVSEHVRMRVRAYGMKEWLEERGI